MIVVVDGGRVTGRGGREWALAPAPCERIPSGCQRWVYQSKVYGTDPAEADPSPANPTNPARRPIPPDNGRSTEIQSPGLSLFRFPR